MSNDSHHPTAFITKLWDMINDPRTNNLIRWFTGHNTSTVYIQDVSNFSQYLLPQYFSHSNWPSFVRQLNIYGFRRIRGEETRSTDQYQFSHEYFQPHQQYNLHLIKRRGHHHGSSSSNTGSNSPATMPVSVQHHHHQDLFHAGGAAPTNTEIIERIWDQLDKVEAQCAATVSETQRLQRIHAQQQQLLKSIVELIQEVTTAPETVKALTHIHGRLEQATALAYPQQQQQHQQQQRSFYTGLIPPSSPSPSTVTLQQLPPIAELVKATTTPLHSLMATTTLPPLHGPPSD